MSISITVTLLMKDGTVIKNERPGFTVNYYAYNSHGDHYKYWLETFRRHFESFYKTNPTGENKFYSWVNNFEFIIFENYWFRRRDIVPKGK